MTATRHVEDPTGDLRADMLARLDYDLQLDCERTNIEYVRWDRHVVLGPPTTKED